METNRFGTNEFIDFCRKLKTEPYLVVNCGDGGMREAQDWVEYCNGKGNSTLSELRREHGYPKPHNVKYWGVGNEVDGHWQIGYKTPEEYARAFTECGKVMKWTDPDIKLIASAVSDWKGSWVERTQLLLEQVDYFSCLSIVPNTPAPGKFIIRDNDIKQGAGGKCVQAPLPHMCSPVFIKGLAMGGYESDFQRFHLIALLLSICQLPRAFYLTISYYGYFFQINPQISCGKSLKF